MAKNMTFLIRCFTEEDWDAIQQILFGQGITWQSNHNKNKKILFFADEYDWGRSPTIRLVPENGRTTIRYATYKYYQEEYPNHTLLTHTDLETLCVL